MENIEDVGVVKRRCGKDCRCTIDTAFTIIALHIV